MEIIAFLGLAFIVWFSGFGTGCSSEKKITKKILEKLKEEIDPCLFSKIISDTLIEDKYK